MLRWIMLLGIMAANYKYTHAQKLLSAEYIVICPTYGDKYADFRFVHTLSGDMEKREVTDTLLRNEPNTPTSSREGITITGQLFKTWDIVNNATKEAWQLSEQDIKIAVKQDYYAMNDRSFEIDSSAYYEIVYENKFKKIVGYNCQKVVLINKLTKRQDSLYVNKALSHLNFRMTNKYGKIDFIMQGFVSGDGFTNIFSIILAKEITVPVDSFEIPKQYKRFNSDREYNKWWFERVNKKKEGELN